MRFTSFSWQALYLPKNFARVGLCSCSLLSQDICHQNYYRKAWLTTKSHKELLQLILMFLTARTSCSPRDSSLAMSGLLCTKRGRDGLKHVCEALYLFIMGLANTYRTSFALKISREIIICYLSNAGG